MSRNLERMRPWWSLGDAPREVLTDALAFEHHVHAWERRRRRGEGLALALVGPEGLLGEMQVWHLSPGGLTCEVGLWMAPEERAVKRDAAACFGVVYDALFADLGIGRIDAPVAVGNTLPRSLLELWGFEIEARIPRWRDVAGSLADFDLYTLTPERWAGARDEVRRHLGEFERTSVAV